MPIEKCSGRFGHIPTVAGYALEAPFGAAVRVSRNTQVKGASPLRCPPSHGHIVYAEAHVGVFVPIAAVRAGLNEPVRPFIVGPYRARGHPGGGLLRKASQASVS